MPSLNISALKEVAKTIRGLSIDAIEAANSGHPGLPLGCAEIGAYLYAYELKHNPKNPNWINRDRFILSAGHGSMLLYACLHLSGYDLSLDDIKNFRQLNAPTAGHPELGEVPGIETTTGPLGQGLSTAVGMAIGQKMAQAQFKAPLDNYFYVLAGDGCLMEGISSEASSIAGHLKLDNLIVIYDSNDICLDGPTSECFTEDVQKRYESYGWEIVKVDGHDIVDIHNAVQDAKAKDKPVLLVAKTTIGYGSPNRAGTSESHGKPLGSDELQLTKQELGIPTHDTFMVSEEIKAYFKEHQAKLEKDEATWNEKYESWCKDKPEHAQNFQHSQAKTIPSQFADKLKSLELPAGKATRSTSQGVIQFVHDELPYIIGGSADLSCSDSTYMKKSKFIHSKDFSQRNIKYGVREFAMAAIASGISLEGTFKPFIGTFLTFSDYMKNAVRLAALMNLPVIYQFTHDSIFLGEDGPTHQPVEHLASLRSIPNITVIRPADTNEVKAAWLTALTNSGPTALILSRQGLPELESSSLADAQKGAYIIKKESQQHIDTCIIATGSEVSLAIEVAEALESQGKPTRVVSMPSQELFDAQDKAYQDSIIYPHAKKFCVIEAQSSFGWHKYIGKDGVTITVDTFGKSAPAADLKTEYGFTVDAIISKLA